MPLRQFSLQTRMRTRVGPLWMACSGLPLPVPLAHIDEPAGGGEAGAILVITRGQRERMMMMPPPRPSSPVVDLGQVQAALLHQPRLHIIRRVPAGSRRHC